MTLQQLKYMIAVAEAGSITEAARELYISQPSLSAAIKEVEKEMGISIFTRCRAGVSLTKEGMEFLGYARQVVQQMELLESKYVKNRMAKQRFCVSAQHYTFAANAFVELVRRFGQERYEFILNETRTHQIISPHVFLQREHPLASKGKITLKDLKPYPRLSFVQGAYESANFAEELFSNESVEKSIKISDRAAIVNFMVGLDGYTISSGIFPKYLHGDAIVSIPLDEDEVMCIGYILNKDRELSELGEIYVDALKQYKNTGFP